MLATLWVYSFVTGLIALGVGASYSYISGVQSTSQAVFSFSSTDVGIWYAMFEVGNVLSNVLIPYFFSKKSIPKVSRSLVVLFLVVCFYV